MDMMKIKLGLCSIITVLLVSCGDKKQEVQTENTVVKDTISSEKTTNEVADSKEEKLKNFLTTDFLKDDLKFLKEDDRKFQYEDIDLNGDGVPETFVRFSSSYFCGSGGCTFLLLDNNQKVITKFTVMDAPIYIDETVKNGWKVLVIKDYGKVKELVFDGKKYPSNPSMIQKAAYESPSSEAVILFDKPFAESKISIF